MNIDLGRMLVTFGVVLIIVGALIILFSKTTGLPKLPGDIIIKKDNCDQYDSLFRTVLIV